MNTHPHAKQATTLGFRAVKQKGNWKLLDPSGKVTTGRFVNIIKPVNTARFK